MYYYRFSGTHLLFKPVSVQGLWTVYQTLHMIRERMTPRPKVGEDGERTDAAGPKWPHRDYAVTAPQSCINEWHEMDDLLVKRPTSPGEKRSLKANDGQSAEETIKARLRIIMKSADLDSITSKSIRRQLEEDLEENLESFKSFIDKEILVILGQMDPASEILDYLYLGSEWNASNLEELRQNGITRVLNVTREIDNFFPAAFVYHNVREYDEEATDLLKYLDRTYRFIRSAKDRGGKVLVHCKMGISRSATVTISYVMKEYGRNLAETLSMVKGKRPIVNPNKSFLKQLEVYEGILGAIRHRHSYTGGGRMFRSKSESCVAPDFLAADDKPDAVSKDDNDTDVGSNLLSQVTPRVNIKELSSVFNRPQSEPLSMRPKSWSPNEKMARMLLGSGGSDNNNRPNNDHVNNDSFENEDCRCFGDLAQNCGIEMVSHSTCPNDGSDGEDETSGLSSSLNNKSTSNRFIEARNSHCLVVPSSAADCSVASPMPVNSSLYNPNCQCDMELELVVPDDPVCVVESVSCRETEAVVQSISNLPLRIRNSQELSSFSRSNSGSKDAVTTAPDIVIDPTEAVVSSGGENNREELSVRTLANMYDFKKGSSGGGGGPPPAARPCSVARLEDSHLFQKAKKLTTEADSEPLSRQSEC